MDWVVDSLHTGARLVEALDPNGVKGKFSYQIDSSGNSVFNIIKDVETIVAGVEDAVKVVESAVQPAEQPK